ncbi:DUF3772 domain-containing protein [Budvicia diplopodorum]|uniref:DUF3772 domain-containing protein n=1 Tax=Budvicia diplopodorum TaxID=1119056 RepID=UPI001FE2BDDF|nr:DUF3772 domain-containing protein [Budvicia diplopodorum]
MRKLSQALLLAFPLVVMSLFPAASWAETKTDTMAKTQPRTLSKNAKKIEPSELEKLQQKLSEIKQNVSASTKDGELTSLNIQALDLVSKTDDFITALLPELAQVQTQIDVIGAPPAEGAMPESPEVTNQRDSLNAQKALLEKELEHAQTLKTNAANLANQIIALRRNALKTQLALNSGSILGARFWSPVFNPQREDVARIDDFIQQAKQAWDDAWKPEALFGSIVLSILALAVWGYGLRVTDRAIIWICTNAMPDGRLRRSFFSCATVLTALLTGWAGASLLYQVFARKNTLTPSLQSFADGMITLVVFSALIIGLGRAMLSNQRPSWRLAPIPDPVAKALGVFLPALAIILMIFGVLEQVTSNVGSSVPMSIFGNGLVSLLVGGLACLAPMKTNRVRRQLALNGESIEARSTVTGLVHIVASAIAIGILLSLLIGYIPLARFLTYELVWIGIVLSSLYLMFKFVGDFCEALFSTHTASGKWLKQTFNLDVRYLEQATILFSAVGHILLILLAAIALLTGTYGATTPMTIINKVIDIMGSDGFGKINIVPANVLNALISMGLGLYVLRTARHWLSAKFLPKTTMDTGMRMSLVTLFSNIGYVLVILLTLSLLGIEWNKLAWIVSALSVGIGFGLQEIVKNFISGLILLTERPVKVGDLVSIAGVEGDIRRINVRATEIQLGDKSTVIVPNSQFISQSVRNVTMGSAQGVVTIPLTFPLDIDPEQVRTILLEAYHTHESVLDIPAPSVSFSQLTPDGIALSVTGYVNSPRMVSRTKSDLLFDLLKRLRAAEVKLSSPQSLMIQNERGNSDNGPKDE